MSLVKGRAHVDSQPFTVLLDKQSRVCVRVQVAAICKEICCFGIVTPHGHPPRNCTEGKVYLGLVQILNESAVVVT